MDNLEAFIGAKDLSKANQCIKNDQASHLLDALNMLKGYISDPHLNDCVAHVEQLIASDIIKITKEKQTQIQFITGQLERVLSNSFAESHSVPIFNEGDIKVFTRLLETIINSINTPLFEDHDRLFWGECDLAASVLLDHNSIMAQTLIKEEFGADACWVREDDELEKWKRSFSAGYYLLYKHLPNAADIIRKNLATIVPVTSNAPGVFISSTPSYLNGIFLTSLVPGRYMAETLVHEVGHDVLNKIHRYQPLYQNSSPVYYSPFRSDARPASGLLHAAYSFYNVIIFMAKILKNERRLKVWATDRATYYIFDVLLCSTLFQQIKNMPAPGYHLAAKLENNIRKLIKLLPIEFDEDLRESKVKHFESWSESNNNEYSAEIKNTFYKTLHEFNALRSPQTNKISHGSPVTISAQNFKITYSESLQPLIFPWRGLINEKQLKNELNRVLTKQLKFIDMDKHFGHGNTPTCDAFLDDIISEQRRKTQLKNWFLAVLDFSDLVSATVWHDKSFFDSFFLDGEVSWLFWNRAGLKVGLHADTANNLHCLIQGRKIFYVAPATETFPLLEHDEKSGVGFSSFNPFESYDLAREVGWFVTLEAGQAIYIPNNWWHAVQYVEDSIAISAVDTQL